MTIVTITKPDVIHIGTLNPDLRSKGNHEGVGLCVSECPQDWLRIHRLGGRKWFTMHKDNAQFADFQQMDKDILKQWGFEQGYVQERTQYLVHLVCAETDQVQCFHFDSYDEAASEIEEGEPEDQIKTAIFPIATEKMEVHFNDMIHSSFVMPYLFNLYVLKNHPECDGIWFDINNDGQYSAPSGLIFDHKMDSFTSKEIKPTCSTPLY